MDPEDQDDQWQDEQQTSFHDGSPFSKIYGAKPEDTSAVKPPGGLKVSLGSR
jgi:hypothetical protein